MASSFNGIDEKNKNKYIYDYERGEIIDAETGEVIADHLFDFTASPRAEDYVEWNKKRHHEVMNDVKDKKLFSLVWSVGESINAPRWMREEVLRLLMKMKEELRLHRYLRNKPIKPYNVKFILATYYVVAKQRGFIEFAWKIGKMDCGNNTPCYVTNKRKDREFYRYTHTVYTAWSILNEIDYNEEVKSHIRLFINNINIDINVVKHALELLEKVINYRPNPRNLAAALIVWATKELYGEEKAKEIEKQLTEKCDIPSMSLYNNLKELEEIFGKS